MIKYLFEILKLEQHCLYLIDMQYSIGNPIHEGLLKTGFDNGSYLEVIGETIHNIDELYSLKIIKKLTNLNIYLKEPMFPSEEESKVYISKYKFK